MIRFGLVWYGMEWYGMIWFGSFGIVIVFPPSLPPSFPPSLTPSITLFFQYSQALHEGGVAGAVEGLARKGGAFPLWGAWEY